MRPQDDTVLCSCLDFDNHDGTKTDAPEQARLVCKYLESLGQSPLLERSQSGTGYHVWLIHSEPVDARTCRKAWKCVLRDCSIDGVEIYPKQDTVAHLESRLGNLIRYPLWQESRFETPSGSPLDALTTLQMCKTTPKSFFESKAIVEDSEGIGEVNREYETEGLPSRVEYLLNTEEGSLLGRRWVCDVGGMSGQKSRSDLACSIAAELARYMVPTPEIEAALRYWCKLHEYDKDDRWIKRTVCASYAYAESRGGTHKAASREIKKLLHGQLDILAQGTPEIIPTGIKAIDDVHGGILEVGELGLLGARPSAGKSALSIEIMDAATSAGYPSVFFSLEMSPRAVANRYFNRLGIPAAEIHTMSLAQLHTYVDEKFKGKQPLDFQCTFKLDEIVRSIIDYGKRGYRFAVIDYSTLVVTGIGDERRHYEKITVDLARTAKEADVAILLIHPLKKEYEVRGGRPKMSDFVYAGDYAADVILALQYLYQESATPENASRMVFHTLKSRNRGFRGNPYIELHFNPEQQCFGSARY